MTSRVIEIDWIVADIRVTIPGLGVDRVGNDAIRLDEAVKRSVIKALKNYNASNKWIDSPGNDKG
jgi:hypothetical protein